MENRIIYFLTIEDVQKAAMETINRELTFAEIESIKEQIAARIDWFETISTVVRENFEKS